MNLYSFLVNNGISDIDRLGLIDLSYYSCNAEATWEVEYAKVSSIEKDHLVIDSQIIPRQIVGTGIADDLEKAASDAMDKAALLAKLDLIVTPTPQIRASFSKAWFTYKGITSLTCTKCCIDVAQSGPPLDCKDVDVSKIKKESKHDKGAQDAADGQNKKILRQIIGGF